MAADTTDLDLGPRPAVPSDTVLTDRQIAVHTLDHAEAINELAQSIDDRLARLEELLEEFGPLIDKWRKRGNRGARLL